MSEWSSNSIYKPLCYRADVSQERINQWKQYKGIKHSSTKLGTSGESNKTAKTLPIGSFSKLYSRADWEHWVDYDYDCQDERAETLIRHSTAQVWFQSKNNCIVSLGKWHDRYSDASSMHATDLDIDHIVALSWANGHGGSDWPKRRKMDFANDPENLLPVSASVNRSKGNKGPDEWMPPNHAYRCQYLKSFDSVVVKYDLMYTPKEKRLLVKMKKECGN